MRAALYARFSTDKQASIEDQLRVCRRVATLHGFDVVATFEDAAISGGTSQRPGYQALLAAARRHDVDVIVAEDASRLWRNMAERRPASPSCATLACMSSRRTWTRGRNRPNGWEPSSAPPRRPIGRRLPAALVAASKVARSKPCPRVARPTAMRRSTAGARSCRHKRQSSGRFSNGSLGGKARKRLRST